MKKTQQEQPQPHVNVKKASKDDPAVIALEKDMQADHMAMYGEPDLDPDNDVFTATGIILGYVGEAPVGLCAWGQWPNGDGKIRATYVDPEFRRSGVAQMMVAFIEDLMRTRGIKYNRFESGPEHTKGHRFWTALGYKQLDETFGFYADTEGSRFYGKEL